MSQSLSDAPMFPSVIFVQSLRVMLRAWIGR